MLCAGARKGGWEVNTMAEQPSTVQGEYNTDYFEWYSLGYYMRTFLMNYVKSDGEVPVL